MEKKTYIVPDYFEETVVSGKLYQTDTVIGAGSNGPGSNDDNTPIKSRGYDAEEKDWGDVEKSIW